MMTGLRAWKFGAGLIRSGISPALLILCSSCAIRGNVEMLEAQLRTQESRIRSYEQDIAQLQSELNTTHKEMDLLRTALAGQGSPVAYEEESASLARAQELVFNSLLTAAQDHDGVEGDERFHAVFYPCDTQGGPVKLTGHIELEAIDPSRKQGDRSLGHWQYSTTESRKLWHVGFLSSGFQVSENWTRPPSGSKVILVVKMTTLDGREFEATHTLSVTPSTSATPGKTKIPNPPLNLPDRAEASQSRPVPDPESWEHEQPVPGALGPRPGSASKPGTMPVHIAEPLFEDAPGPARSGVKTSDRWAEDEIPILR